MLSGWLWLKPLMLAFSGRLSSRSFKLSMTITNELHTFLPVLVTVTNFEGHKGIRKIKVPIQNCIFSATSYPIKCKLLKVITCMDTYLMQSSTYVHFCSWLWCLFNNNNRGNLHSVVPHRQGCEHTTLYKIISNMQNVYREPQNKYISIKCSTHAHTCAQGWGKEVGVERKVDRIWSQLYCL